MSNTATPSPIESMDAVRRLAALRILDARKERLDLRLKAKRKEWADALGEQTKALHETIEQPNPGKLKEAKDRLDRIRSLYERRKEMENEKKKEIDAITTQTNRVEAAIVELIRSDPDDMQQELELDDKASPTLNMTADTAKEVGEAIQDLTREGAEITADVEDLKTQLKDMGLASLRLVDDPGDGEAKSDDEEQPPDDE